MNKYEPSQCSYVPIQNNSFNGNIFDCEIKIMHHNNKMICPFAIYDGATKKLIKQCKNED